MLNQRLKKLCEISGVSGFEGSVIEYIKTEMTPYADELKVDALGSLICLKKGKEPGKVMLAAHADEIGFMVNYIDKEGFIRFAPIGGINLRACLYSAVKFENGVRGILLSEDPKDPKPDNCYVDIGAVSRADGEKRVKIGDTFALEGRLFSLAHSVRAGRPLDNRAGCAVLMEIMERLETPACDTYFVFSSEEEVGVRGAGTAAYGIMPDVGIAIDVTSTGDYPGAKKNEVRQGGGPAIKIKDASLICDRRLVELMQRTAEANGIKYQNEILLAGGTDASAMQRTGTGAIAGGISIPSRNIHSGVETVDLRDLEGIVKLSVALAEGPIMELIEK